MLPGFYLSTVGRVVSIFQHGARCGGSQRVAQPSACQVQLDAAGEADLAQRSDGRVNLGIEDAVEGGGGYASSTCRRSGSEPGSHQPVTDDQTSLVHIGNHTSSVPYTEDDSA